MDQSARDYLASEVKRLAEACKSITRKAEDENRDMTEDEKAKIAEYMKTVGEHKTRIDEIDSRKDLQDQIDRITAPGGKPSEAPSEPKTVGEAFVKSEAYQALKSRGFSMGGTWSTGPVRMPEGLKVQDGGGLEVVGIGDVGGGLPLQPQIARSPLSPVEQRLVVAQLFGQGVATQNSIVYLEETTTTPGVFTTGPYDSDTDAAVTTAEGGAKPAANIDWTKRTTSLVKLAAFLPISDEMLEDEPQLASYVNGRLSLFLRQAEEAYLVDTLLAAGIGSAVSNEIVGGNNIFDAIAAGILAVQNEGGLEPDTVLLNPFDFWRMNVQKSTATGDYFSGGPYAAPARNPWGIQAIPTRAVARGSPIVGAFREGATVWRKGTISIEASNSHSDYFRRNLTALRVEERIGLTVYRVAAFQTVSVVS